MPACGKQGVRIYYNIVVCRMCVETVRGHAGIVARRYMRRAMLTRSVEEYRQLTRTRNEKRAR